VWNVLEAIIGGEVPEPGSVVGVYPKTVCDQCPRVRENTKITEFHRPHEVIADPERCFLEQGIFCAGPATRAGCNKPEQAPLCISADMPCRGCYGPPEGVDDQGAKMVAVVASMIDSQDEEEIERILADLVDPVGTFYRFSLSDSMLRQALKGGQE
jgi:F420-non-reducing hydrogenase small subunit